MKNSGYYCFSTNGTRRTGYTRLSKKELDGRDTLNRHVQQLKEAGATEVYWDIISRSSLKRVGLTGLIELVKEKNTSEIILIRLDRLTDSHALMEEFIELVIKSNIPCRGLHDSIDLTTVGGRTHARLLVTFSRNEMERISERFKDGWEGVRRRQKAVHPPFGYITQDNKHKLDHTPFLCLVESKQEISRAYIAKEIVEIFLNKKSMRGCVREINERYGLWHSNHGGNKAGFSTGGLFQMSVSGLKYWLTSPVLQGHLVYFRGAPNEILIPNNHADQAIISSDQFEEIKIIIEHNRKIGGFGAMKERYPLSGLIYCNECGGNCHSMTAGKRGDKLRTYFYYRCKNAALGACSSKSCIRGDVAEERVIAELTKRAESLSMMITPEPLIKSLELIGAEQELENLKNLPNYPEIEALKQRLKIKIDLFKSRQSNGGHHIDKLKKMVIEAFSDGDLFRTQSEAYRKTMYQHLVEKVIVTKEGYGGINRKKEAITRERAVVKQIILKI